MYILMTLFGVHFIALFFSFYRKRRNDKRKQPLCLEEPSQSIQPLVKKRLKRNLPKRKKFWKGKSLKENCPRTSHLKDLVTVETDQVIVIGKRPSSTKMGHVTYERDHMTRMSDHMTEEMIIGKYTLLRYSTRTFIIVCVGVLVVVAGDTVVRRKEGVAQEEGVAITVRIIINYDQF